MYTQISLFTLSAFAVVSLPLSLFSQGAPPLSGPQMQPGPSVSDLMSELELLEKLLDPIEQQALVDPSLMELQQEISDEIMATMINSDSLLAQKLHRLQEIVAEIHDVNADPARVMQLSAEVIEIKPYIDAAQARAMATPEIVLRVDGFHALVHKRMEEIDPDAQALIARHQAIERLLRAALDEVEKPAPPHPTSPLPLSALGVRG